MITRATRGQREIWYMESGPSRVNAPLEGPVIPRSRRDLFKDQSFGESDNAGIKADMWHAGGVLHAKKGFRWGEGAHREWYSVGETRRRGTVVGVCLVPEGGVRVVSGETRMECSLRTRIRG